MLYITINTLFYILSLLRTSIFVQMCLYIYTRCTVRTHSINANNTDFERKRSVTILGNDQMDEVKEKMDGIHKFLRKQVCLVEDAEAVDTEGRADE